MNGSKLNLVVKHAAGSTASTTTINTSASTSTAATASASSTATTVSSITKEPSKKGQFQVLLKQYLEQHYTPEDVTKLMEEVNKVIGSSRVDSDIML